MPTKKSSKAKPPVPAAKPVVKVAPKAAPKPVPKTGLKSAPSTSSKAAPKIAAAAVADPPKKAAPVKIVPKTIAKATPAVIKATPKETPVKTPAKASVKEPNMAPISGVFVRFERYSPKSSRVDLVGSFNGWALGKFPLVRDENGIWSLQIRLSPGTYEYKYVYDGHFYEPDPEQEQIANPFGSANNLLIVT